jgi:uncharacterized protein with GYD domain
MATFISQLTLTEKGAGAIKDTCARAAAFREKAAALGVEVQDIFWTFGTNDGLIIFDAPDAETAATLMFRAASEGNIRTQTVQAFRADTVSGLIAKL